METLYQSTAASMNDRSLSTSTGWAVHRGRAGSRMTDFMPMERGVFPRIRSGEALSGANFGADGLLNDPVNGHFQSLAVARAIANRQTLNENHVNLEGPTGKWLKASMALPYQEHSRVDPMKAAHFARIMRGGALIGGVSLLAGVTGCKPRLAQQHAPLKHQVSTKKLAPLMSKYGFELFDSAKGGVALLGPAVDDEMAEQTLRGMTNVTLLAHGNDLESRWKALTAPGKQVPVQELLTSTYQKTGAGSVLVSSCNPGNYLVESPPKKLTVYGLGNGVVHWTTSNQHASWKDAVALGSGKETLLYPLNTTASYLRATGHPRPRGGRTPTVGIVRDAQGQLRIGAYPEGWTLKSVAEGMGLPGEIPPISARLEGKNWRYHVGQNHTFNDYQGARSFLFNEIKSGRGSEFLPPKNHPIISLFQRVSAEGAPRAEKALAGEINRSPLSKQHAAKTSKLGSTPLQNAQVIARRGTLNELHVNLETNVGGWLKRLFKLPFKRHSRVDPMAAALTAREMLSNFLGDKGGQWTLLSEIDRPPLHEAVPEGRVKVGQNAQFYLSHPDSRSPHALAAAVHEGAHQVRAARGVKAYLSKSPTIRETWREEAATNREAFRYLRKHLPRNQALQAGRYLRAAQGSYSASYSVLRKYGAADNIDALVDLDLETRRRAMRELVDASGRARERILSEVGVKVKAGEYLVSGVPQPATPVPLSNILTHVANIYEELEDEPVGMTALVKLAEKAQAVAGMDTVEMSTYLGLSKNLRGTVLADALDPRFDLGKPDYRVMASHPEVGPSYESLRRWQDWVREHWGETSSAVPAEDTLRGAINRSNLSRNFQKSRRGDGNTVQIAKKIARRGTLNELHVNLETKVGGWLKRVMRLPFKRHSRFAPMAGAMFATAFLAGGILANSAGQKVPLQFQRGAGQAREVALTFDDGPYGDSTRQILDVLKRERVPATFFITGKQASKYPELVKRMAAEGHVVANHTWSHTYYEHLSPEQLRGELTRTSNLVRRLIGKPTTLVRPPGFHYRPGDLKVAQDLGMTHVFGDVSQGGGQSTTIPFSPRGEGGKMARYIVRKSQPGTIALFHDAHLGTAEAVEETIHGLRERGFGFTTPDRMMQGGLTSEQLRIGHGNRIKPNIVQQPGPVSSTPFGTVRTAGGSHLSVASSPLSKNLEKQLRRSVYQSSLRDSLQLAQRGTLNELHVNLETKVGGWLKKAFRLPFKKHSRVDPMKSARFLEGLFRPRGLSSTFAAELEKLPSFTARSQRHMAEAFGAANLKIRRTLGQGAEATVFELESDQVLKVYRHGNPLKGGYGTRAFDAPVLQHGQLTVGSGPKARTYHYLVQPKAEILGDELAQLSSEAQAFEVQLQNSGYQFWDRSMAQLGRINGEIKVIDPRSVAPDSGNVIHHAPAQGVVKGTRPQKLGPRTQLFAELDTTGKEVSQVQARQLIRGETLNEYHQNLESPTGKWLKDEMNLPYQQHSRWDRMATAVFAATMLGGFASSAEAAGSLRAPSDPVVRKVALSIARANKGLPGGVTMLGTTDIPGYSTRLVKDPGKKTVWGETYGDWLESLKHPSRLGDTTLVFNTHGSDGLGIAGPEYGIWVDRKGPGPEDWSWSRSKKPKLKHRDLVSLPRFLDDLPERYDMAVLSMCNPRKVLGRGDIPLNLALEKSRKFGYGKGTTVTVYNQRETLYLRDGRLEKRVPHTPRVRRGPVAMTVSPSVQGKFHSDFFNPSLRSGPDVFVLSGRYTTTPLARSSTVNVLPRLEDSEQAKKVLQWAETELEQELVGAVETKVFAGKAPLIKQQATPALVAKSTKVPFRLPKPQDSALYGLFGMTGFLGALNRRRIGQGIGATVGSMRRFASENWSLLGQQAALAYATVGAQWASFATQIKRSLQGTREGVVDLYHQAAAQVDAFQATRRAARKAREVLEATPVQANIPVVASSPLVSAVNTPATTAASSPATLATRTTATNPASPQVQSRMHQRAHRRARQKPPVPSTQAVSKTVEEAAESAAKQTGGTGSTLKLGSLPAVAAVGVVAIGGVALASNLLGKRGEPHESRRKTEGGASRVRMSTNVTIQDKDLDPSAVDRLFSTFHQTGFAHS